MRWPTRVSLLLALVTGLCGFTPLGELTALAQWTAFMFAVLFLIFFILGLPESRNLN